MKIDILAEKVYQYIYNKRLSVIKWSVSRKICKITFVHSKWRRKGSISNITYDIFIPLINSKLTLTNV